MATLIEKKGTTLLYRVCLQEKSLLLSRASFFSVRKVSVSSYWGNNQKETKCLFPLKKWLLTHEVPHLSLLSIICIPFCLYPPVFITFILMILMCLICYTDIYCRMILFDIFTNILSPLTQRHLTWTAKQLEMSEIRRLKNCTGSPTMLHVWQASTSPGQFIERAAVSS